MASKAYHTHDHDIYIQYIYIYIYIQFADIRFAVELMSAAWNEHRLMREQSAQTTTRVTAILMNEKQ